MVVCCTNPGKAVEHNGVHCECRLRVSQVTEPLVVPRRRHVELIANCVFLLAGARPPRCSRSSIAVSKSAGGSKAIGPPVVFEFGVFYWIICFHALAGPRCASGTATALGMVRLLWTPSRPAHRRTPNCLPLEAGSSFPVSGLQVPGPAMPQLQSRVGRKYVDDLWTVAVAVVQNVVASEIPEPCPVARAGTTCGAPPAGNNV